MELNRALEIPHESLGAVGQVSKPFHQSQKLRVKFRHVGLRTLDQDADHFEKIDDVAQGSRLQLAGLMQCLFEDRQRPFRRFTCRREGLEKTASVKLFKGRRLG